MDALAELLKPARHCQPRGRMYKMCVYPAKPTLFDEGLRLLVCVRARNRQHAIKRVLRYVPGHVSDVELVYRQRRPPSEHS